MNFSNLMYV